jgi:hypothetical protein
MHAHAAVRATHLGHDRGEPLNDDSEEATTSKIKNTGAEEPGVAHLLEHLSHTYQTRVPNCHPATGPPVTTLNRDAQDRILGGSCVASHAAASDGAETESGTV